MAPIQIRSINNHKPGTVLRDAEIAANTFVEKECAMRLPSIAVRNERRLACLSLCAEMTIRFLLHPSSFIYLPDTHLLHHSRSHAPNDAGRFTNVQSLLGCLPDRQIRKVLKKLIKN